MIQQVYKSPVYLTRTADKILHYAYFEQDWVGAAEIIKEVMVSNTQVYKEIRMNKASGLMLVDTMGNKGKTVKITDKGSDVMEKRMSSPYPNVATIEHVLLAINERVTATPKSILHDIYDPIYPTENQLKSLSCRCLAMAKEGYLLRKLDFSNNSSYSVSDYGRDKLKYIQDHRYIYKDARPILLESEHSYKKPTYNFKKQKKADIIYVPSAREILMNLFGRITTDRKAKSFHI